MNDIQVSVVIPARDSHKTIRATIESVLCQTYKPFEIIVAASYLDLTENAIKDFIQSKKVKYIKIKVRSYIRDAHLKRWLGASKVKGNYIFFTDSKAILDTNAIQRAVNLIKEYNVHVVAGVAKSWRENEDTIVSKLQDKGLIKNNPKFPKLGRLNIDNFGNSESLPVTTALLMSKKAFEAIKGDFGLEYSKIATTYDDYVTAWLLVKNGYEILLTNEVVSYHKHRNWKEYFKQISRSGQSAALMHKYYSDCPYAKRRQFEVFSFLGLNIFFLVIVIVMIFKSKFNDLSILTICGILTLIAAGVVNVIVEKDIETFIFPPLTYLSIWIFCSHYLKWFFYKSKDYGAKILNYYQLH
jgi:glycosyltransferase involved in cell wall biosynthesis